MKEEFLLEQRFGKPKPFRVPEGYFNQIETRMIKNITKHEVTVRKCSVIRRLVRPVTWAACMALVIGAGVIYFNNLSGRLDRVGDGSECLSSAVYADYVIDEVSDYAMLDNDDFYSYISDE